MEISSGSNNEFEERPLKRIKKLPTIDRRTELLEFLDPRYVSSAAYDTNAVTRVFLRIYYT